MRYIIHDKKYRFKSAFDTETGAYVRTGILDKNGKDTGVDPFMASYPHLIDVGIMGHCIHGKTGLCAKAGIGCYQSGLLVEQPNMSVDDFRWIAEQSNGKCNQFALGGRGDPDQHEHFEEILKICRENILVPNFTTSGYGMTPEIAKLCKQYCGAVAVSWYRSEYTLNAIQMLLDAGVKTNIHYVLGKNSIDEAIDRLKRNDFPKGINAVIFLLHKPAGQGTKANMLSFEDPRVAEFFAQVDRRHAKNKSSTASVVDLDIENVLAHCMESDLETYQCWRHDGNEGFYEASNSDAGLAFVVVHDLLATTGFPNVREMLEDNDTLTALLEEVDFNSGEEV